MNTLSDEQLKELEVLYHSIERKKVDPNEDFEVTDEEYRKFVTFWSSLHNSFPELLSTIRTLTRERDEAREESSRLKGAQSKWRMERIEGRREALAIITRTCPEGFVDKCQGSGALADTGDYTTHWKEKALAELLDCEKTESFAEHCEGKMWEAMGEKSFADFELTQKVEALTAERDVLKEDVQQWKAAHEADKSVNASLRAELAASKEREHGLRDENARLRAALIKELATFKLVVSEDKGKNWDDFKAEATSEIDKKFPEVISSQPPQSPWRPIAEAPKGQKIVAGYWNQLGNWRSVMACYYPPKTLPATDDYMADDEWAPEGWYEESETHEELHKLDCPPVLWQPLHQPPTKGEES